jgi:hypothetical protein
MKPSRRNTEPSRLDDAKSPSNQSRSAPHIPAKHFRLKRVYEPAAPEDGVRVLIDRLWPRGLTKEKAAIDHWMKDIARSHFGDGDVCFDVSSAQGQT